jgi:hypothetical protein
MSSSSEPPATVALVGLGRRARQTILPALHALGDRIELTGVFTRTARTEELFGGARTVHTRDDLTSADLSDVNVVVVAVDLRSVPGVLDQLAAAGTGTATVMLDTPVVHYRDVAVLEGFDRFGEVLVSEDCLALPPFVLARHLLDEGRLGELRKAYLFHSGYRHHALATLQGLVGSGRPTRLRVRRFGRGSAEVRVSFRGGVEATLVEPRDYGVGRFLVAGTKAFVADYPITHKDAIEIGYALDDGQYRGLLLDGEPVPPDDLDLTFVQGVPRDLEDTSTMALLKVRGFMSLVDAVIAGHPQPRKLPVDALVDDLSLRVAERLGVFADAPVGEVGAASTAAVRRLAALAGWSETRLRR